MEKQNPLGYAQGVLFLRRAEALREPEGSDLGTRMRVPRSVRRKKGPPDLFLFPPHPFFCISNVAQIMYNYTIYML